MSDVHLSRKVLIVGAGPTGLTLAYELLRQGVQVRLIEKELTASQNTKALGVWPRTLELFARTRTGIVEEMLDRGVKTPTFSVWSEGKRLVYLDFAHQLAGTYPFALMLPQPETETLLTRHVERLGGSIERGRELVSLTQQEEGVQVVLRHADGAEEGVLTDWLIGCDGASSMVRHLLGVSFVGRTFEQSFVTGDVRIQWDFPPDGAHFFISHSNTIGFFPMPEAGYYRVVITYRPGSGPQGEPTLAEIQRAISTYARAGVQASDPIGLTRFAVNQRRVERPVSGRVILAGDASHIHTFVGAQGMNAGIQDAFNLGWKLALVVRGKAAAHLLESYGQECEHVSKALLAATGLGARLALLQQPLLTGVRDFMAPRVSALRWTQQRLINALAGLSISYRDSSIVQDERLEGGRDRAHLHAGDRAPDGSIWEGSARVPHPLFELLSDTRHTLLVFSQSHSADLAALARLLPAFEDLIESYQIVQGTSWSGEQEGTGKPFYDPDGSLARRYGLVNRGLVLIRPDGYIGFRSRAIGGEQLHRYLQNLFSTAS